MVNVLTAARPAPTAAVMRRILPCPATWLRRVSARSSASPGVERLHRGPAVRWARIDQNHADILADDRRRRDHRIRRGLQHRGHSGPTADRSKARRERLNNSEQIKLG